MSLRHKESPSQGDNGSHYPSIILNQLMQQSLGQGGLQAPVGLPFASCHGAGNNSYLAAAVQQQLVASLASSNLPLLQPMGLAPQQSLVNEFSSSQGLLPRSAQGVMLQGNPSATSVNLLSLAGRQSVDLQRDLSNGSRDGGTESYKKVPTTQIPCQARGMSTDHNSLTAYFEIPSDATHGQHLYCSHPTCRAAGVKFRYCLHCKKPVTKQNFRSRHLHADLEKSPTNASKSSQVPGGETARKESTGDRVLPLVHPPAMTDDLLQRTPNGEVVGPSFCEAVGAQTGAPNSVSCSDLEQTHGQNTSDTSLVGDKTAGLLKKRKQFSNSAPDPESFDTAIAVVGRRRRWSSLLRERPREMVAINEWLSKVIAASDPSTPFALTNGSLAHGGILVDGSIQQQSMWDELLAQRPSNLDPCNTDWLVKVLKISSSEYDASVGAGFSDGANVDKVVPPANMQPKNSLFVENEDSQSGTNLENVPTAKRVKRAEVESENSCCV